MALFANAYRWRCTTCGVERHATLAGAFVGCPSCRVRHAVLAVHHQANGQKLEPGAAPTALLLAENDDNAPSEENIADEEDDDSGYSELWLLAGAVELVAYGYAWRCPECEMVGFRPGVSVQEVVCALCRSSYAVCEVRHRAGPADLSPGVHPGARYSDGEPPAQTAISAGDAAGEDVAESEGESQLDEQDGFLADPPDG